MIHFWLKADEDKLRIVSTVHDSLKVWVREDCVEEFVKLSVETFTYDVFRTLSDVYHYKFSTPLGCGIKVAKHWGEGDEVAYDLDPLTNRLEIKEGKTWKALS